jgi:hypothetical protein
MSATANVLSTLGEGGRTMLPLARRETPRATRRIPATDQLTAPPCEVGLPTLEEVPIGMSAMARKTAEPDPDW